MNKNLLFNILGNIFISVVFVILNTRALSEGLEETFVSLAILFGLVVTVFNAAYINLRRKK